MKKIASLIMSIALASSAFAGSPAYSGKSGKGPVMPLPPTCDAFGPGFSLGAFGTGFIPKQGGDDALGGGALAEYFFNENFGIQGSYSASATHTTHHQFDADLILRAPIKSLCIAPYLMVGGGFSTNSETVGDWHVGGGIEAHFAALKNINIFADGAYHFHSDSDLNFTLVRLGIKFHL